MLNRPWEGGGLKEDQFRSNLFLGLIGPSEMSFSRGLSRCGTLLGSCLLEPPNVLATMS